MTPGIPDDCDVETESIDDFDSDLKRISRKYRGFAADFEVARRVLLVEPLRGPVVPNTNQLRKMRISSKALRRGASGGFRLVYHVFQDDRVFRITLLRLFFKGDMADLDQAEYRRLSALVRASSRASSP